MAVKGYISKHNTFFKQGQVEVKCDVFLLKSIKQLLQCDSKVFFPPNNSNIKFVRP